MKAIAAVCENLAIGKNNSLLVSIPEDMKFFRETTLGGTVIMGRKTLESFPQGRPLKNRVNIVITKDKTYAPEGVIVVHDTENAVKAAKQYGEDNIFVIGGESIYRQMIPLCDTVYITKIGLAPEADAFFPDLDSDPAWKIAAQSEVKEYEGIRYSFQTYVRARG